MLAKALDYYFKHMELFILICRSQKGTNDPSSFLSLGLPTFLFV